MKRCILVMAVFAAITTFGQTLKKWEAGYLDIHHINTGRGDCTFCVLPDGTTLLIDAGEVKADVRVVAPKPDNLKRTGEWIADYITSFIPNGKKYIDYYLLTHYHSDHIGALFSVKEEKKNYYLTGVTDVYQHFPAHIIVDRGGDFFPPSFSDSCYANYCRFIKSIGNKVEHQTFKVGTDEQISLLYNKVAYPSFYIQNVYANGMLALKNDEIDTFFSNRIHYTKEEMPRENMYSCVVKLTYGLFDYYTGGDIPGYPRPGRPLWHDIESPVSDIVGKVEVAVLNHHGYEDGTNEHFLMRLSPQNIIMSAWDALHPNHTVLARTLSREIYPESRNVMSTNLHPAAKIVIGSLTDKMISTQGHIVVRVYPGGTQYSIYILNDSDSKHLIRKELGIFDCTK